MTENERIQAAYYERTAATYDALHQQGASEHDVALRYVAALLPMLGAKSVLDVGAGTGRAVSTLQRVLPGLEVRGVEPVPALVDQAVSVHGIAPGTITQGRGEALPFGDGSFDVVCAFGILHHVATPAHVIAEMTRVARKAVLISDSNRFGQGHPVARVVKLAAHRLGLWPALDFVKTRGRGYTITEGDGLAYSYSVYDSYDQLAAWATRMVLVPTSPHVEGPARQFGPLLSAPSVLACAIRD